MGVHHGIPSLPGEQALQLLLGSPLDPSFFPVLDLLSVYRLSFSYVLH